MPGRLFVTVRFVAPRLAFAEHTRRNPGATVDAIVASFEEAPSGGSRIVALAQVRGMPPASFDALLADLRERYGGVSVLASEPQHQSWLLRCILDRDALPGVARFIVDFQQRFCMPWTHVEDGRVLLRAETRSEANGSEEAARVQAYLDDHGIEGTAACTQVRGQDLETWQMLCALVAAAADGDERVRPAWERVGRVRDLE